MAPDARIAIGRIRVLRIITRLNIGGPAIHAMLLSGQLDPERFETTLVAGREDPSEGSMLELGRLARPVRPIRVSTLGRSIAPIQDVRALAAVLALVRRYRPHVVHTHLAKAGFVGRIAARLARVPVVVHTYHGSVLRGYFGTRESGLYLRVERLLARVTTRLVAVSPAVRRELLEMRIARPDRIVEIPLGLDLGPFLAAADPIAARRALDLPDDVPVVGIVGRLVPIKDVDTFLRAVARVRVERPDVVALIVGDGSERPALERLARQLDLTGTCRFLGFRADIPAILSALDVLVLTSTNEGTPVSLIEGMAAQKAVVGTAVGGVPDVVSDGTTGLLTRAGDDASIAAAILRLIRDPALRAELSGRASSAVRDRYGASRLVHDIERLYRDLLDRTH